MRTMLKILLRFASRFCSCICISFSIYFPLSAFASEENSSLLLFEIHGLEEKSKGPNYDLSIKASWAEGLGKLETKTLYKPQIEISDAKQYMHLSASKAYFHKKEILLSGMAEFALSKTKTSGKTMTLKSNGPEDIFYFQMQEAKLTAPAATLLIRGQTYSGRGLVVDLHTRRITWAQNVALLGGRPLKTPFDLKF